MNKIIIAVLLSLFTKSGLAQSSDLFKKFGEVKKQAQLYVTNHNDTLAKAFEFLAPFTGSYANGNVSVHPVRGILDASPLMLVLLKETEFKELKRYTALDTLAIETISMFYQPEPIFINGGRSNMIFASEEAFKSFGIKSNSLFLIHTLCHYLQDMRNTSLPVFNKQVESYSMTTAFFTLSLSSSEQSAWNSLIERAHKDNFSEKMIANSYYVSACDTQFGDKGLVYFLLIEVLTSNVFVSKYYK